MIYPDFDLNLLRALDALLAERSVTRAAGRVGITQPAMSRALARLRDVLDDPVLVRGGRGMEPTARAAALTDRVRRILEEARDAMSEATGFDPATSERTFTVATTDYVEVLVLPLLLGELARAAPGVDLVIRRSRRERAELEEAGDLDLVIAPSGRDSPVVRQQHLFDEGFACIVRRDHPAVGSRLSRRRYAALPHLLIAPGGRPGGVVDDALREHGLRRRVALRAPSFLVPLK